MSIENFSIPELVWTVLNAGTVLVTAILYREARLDLRAVLRDGRDGLLLRVARGGARRMGYKLFIASAFLGAGLWSGFFVPVNRQAGTVASDLTNLPATVVTIAFFMLADVALLLLAIEAARERLYAMEYLETGEHERAPSDATTT